LSREAIVFLFTIHSFILSVSQSVGVMMLRNDNLLGGVESETELKTATHAQQQLNDLNRTLCVCIFSSSSYQNHRRRKYQQQWAVVGGNWLTNDVGSDSRRDAPKWTVKNSNNEDEDDEDNVDDDIAASFDSHEHAHHVLL